MKDARIRQDKAEEESVDLSNKAKHLEIECDVYGEKLSLQVMAQEAMEAQVLSAEAEFNRLNRRWDLNIQGYPLRMRLQRRLSGIYSVCFLIVMIP